MNCGRKSTTKRNCGNTAVSPDAPANKNHSGRRHGHGQPHRLIADSVLVRRSNQPQPHVLRILDSELEIRPGVVRTDNDGDIATAAHGDDRSVGIADRDVVRADRAPSACVLDDEIIERAEELSVGGVENVQEAVERAKEEIED